MRKQIAGGFNVGNIKSINLDDDMYCKIVDYRRDYCKIDRLGNICLVNRKGIKVPIWRIVRKCWNKDLYCKYYDNDRTNLTRGNIQLCRKQINQ